MLQIKNTESGQMMTVSNTTVIDGQIVGNYVFGTRYYNKYTMLHQMAVREFVVRGENKERPILTLDEPWQIIDQPRKPRAPRKPQPEPIIASPVDEGCDNVDVTAAALADLLRGLQVKGVSGVTEDDVRSIVRDMMSEMTTTTKIVVKTPKHIGEVKGVTHAKFEDICALINAGLNVFLYGDAGTGKSQLAEQVGTALGLDVYQIGAVRDVYQLRGSFTATGEYIPSTFYNAFTKGGLLIIDEGDAMDADASLELNGALSQRTFDFPIVGNMKAHPDFRVIITGNTAGTGATEKYTGRSCLDAALLNRCFMVEIDYDRGIEMACAGEDNAELVDFIHDLRNAANVANITLVVSYRNIGQIATLKGVISDDNLICGAITKGMCKDECTILYDNLTDKTNNWAKMFKKAAC